MLAVLNLNCCTAQSDGRPFDFFFVIVENNRKISLQIWSGLFRVCLNQPNTIFYWYFSIEFVEFRLGINKDICWVRNFEEKTSCLGPVFF